MTTSDKLNEAHHGWYLITTQGDVAYSKLVKGMDSVYRTLLSEVLYGDIREAPQDVAMQWNFNLQDPDQWKSTFDFPFWRFEVHLEDGSVAVQRVLDVSVATYNPSLDEALNSGDGTYHP